MLQETAREPFGIHFASIWDPIWTPKHAQKATIPMPAGLWKGIQQHCKQRSVKAALGRPLARMRQLDSTTAVP